MSFIGEYRVDRAAALGAVRFAESHMHLAKAGMVGLGREINTEIKQSADISLTRDMMESEALRPYFSELQKCVEAYKETWTFSTDLHARWGLIESPNIQIYPPGGGFKIFHFERHGTGEVGMRHLAFMTYLSDIPIDEGGGTEFLYQKIVFPCSFASTLIWPADWTHTHRGVVSDTHTKTILTGWLSYY